MARHPFVRSLSSSRSRFARPPLAAAALLVAAAPAAAQLAPVTVTGRVAPPAEVAGWGGVPAERLPVTTASFGAAELRDAGAQRLADLATLSPSVGPSYASEGYWDIVSIRGFTLDNRYSWRRDGLPISAETVIPLDNKARVELLEGAAGLEAGVGSPGGLVDLIVKRPLAGPLRSASFEWRSANSLSGAVDLSQRFGADGRFGVRLNAAVATLDPELRDARGSRHLLAWAGEWRVSSDTLLELEFETSRRRQPSQAAFSLRGDTVPPPPDPRLNLNNQAWSAPVVSDAHTASLRWRQRLAGDWQATVQALTQRLHTDDRIAFPFGCSNEAEYLADRFCSDGSFDLYDYRSDERRRTAAAQLRLDGRLQAGGWAHHLGVGVQHWERRDLVGEQAFNYVGAGADDGSVPLPADPTPYDAGIDRRERATELSLRDRIDTGTGWGGWLGLRHTRLDRGTKESFTTPFVALTRELGERTLAYASLSRGIEFELVPDDPSIYTNAGALLPTVKSRQAELGLRGGEGDARWRLALFDLRRPVADDVGECLDEPTARCTRAIDGRQRHLGLAGSGSLRLGRWTLGAGAQWLRARREGSEVDTRNDRRPVNVPARSFRLQADWQAAEALRLTGRWLHESERFVTRGNDARIPGWSRTDLALAWTRGVLTLRAGVDNLFDKRAWRESPLQFGHAWLYPLAPRTWRVGVEATL